MHNELFATSTAGGVMPITTLSGEVSSNKENLGDVLGKDLIKFTNSISDRGSGL